MAIRLSVPDSTALSNCIDAWQIVCRIKDVKMYQSSEQHVCKEKDCKTLIISSFIVEKDRTKFKICTKSHLFSKL